MAEKNYDSSFDLFYKVVEKKVVFEKSGHCWLKSVVKTDFKGSFAYPILFSQDLSESVDRFVNMLNNSRKENCFYEKQICFMSSESFSSYKVYTIQDSELLEEFF